MGDNMSKIPPKASKKNLEKKQNKNEKIQYLDKEGTINNKEFENTLLSFPSQIFIFKKDKQGRIIIVLSEGKLAKKFGIKTYKTKGKTVKEVFSNKKDYYVVKPYYDRAFSGKKVKYEVEIKNIWFKNIVQPFKRDSKGNVTEIIGYSEDISKRKKAETKLKESETKFKKLFENMSSGVAVYKAVDDGKDFEFIDFNKSGEKIDKINKEDVIGKRVTKVFPGIEKFELLEVLRRVWKTDKPEHHPFITYKDNRIVGWRKNYVYKLPTGEIVAVYDDVTKQEKTKEKLKKYQENLEKIVQDRTEEVEKAHKESEITKNNLQNIIDSASELIISFDKTNRVITWGKRIEKLTGYSNKKIIGKNIQKVKVFDNAEELLENIEKISQSKPPKSNFLILKTKNGSKRIIKTSFSSIKNDDAYEGVVTVGEDITNQIESHGRFISGYSYYSIDEKNESIFNLFKNIVKIHNKKGLYITRYNPEHIKNNIESKEIQTMILKQNNIETHKDGSDLDRIVRRIKNFVGQNKQSIILLDRADYLISNFSFDQFVKHLYEITDIITENNSIFLLYVNSSFFDKKQVSLIKSELLAIPGQELEKIQIKDDYYEILEQVNKYNQNNMLVEFKKISDDLSINRKTLSKKINILEKQGLIIISRQGRSKMPYLTDKAKTLLNKKL